MGFGIKTPFFGLFRKSTVLVSSISGPRASQLRCKARECKTVKGRTSRCEAQREALSLHSPSLHLLPHSPLSSSTHLPLLSLSSVPSRSNVSSPQRRDGGWGVGRGGWGVGGLGLLGYRDSDKLDLVTVWRRGTRSRVRESFPVVFPAIDKIQPDQFHLKE